MLTWDITTKSKMNQKAYSILFCALLASTIAHELRAKSVSLPISSRFHVSKKDDSCEVYELECQHSVTSCSFGLTVHVVKDILVIANQSSNAAFLLNASDHTILLLDGSCGGGMGLDLDAQKGIYFKSGLWDAAHGSLESFILSFSGGLKDICNKPDGSKFSFNSIDNRILIGMNEIVCKLVAHISADLKADAKLGFQIVTAIGGGIVTMLTGGLKGILPLFGSGIIHIAHDLAGFFNVLQGLCFVFEKTSGSLAGAIEAGVSFKPEAIIGAANGLEALANLLLQLCPKNDVGAAVVKKLNEPECLFKLIAQLGGNVNTGINGVFLVVSKIVSLINKKIDVECVINSIVQYVAYSSLHNAKDLTEDLRISLEGLMTVLEHKKAESSCKELVSIITKLHECKLTIDGVDISIIIEKLLKGATVGASYSLTAVACIVLELQAVVEIPVLVPTLLLVLILKLNSASGIEQLIALGIKIESKHASVAGGILKKTLNKKFKFIPHLPRANCYYILEKVPVIGTIVKATDVAVRSASKGKVILKDVLYEASWEQNSIVGLIQMESGMKLGVRPAVISHVKAISEKTCCAGSIISVNISGHGNETLRRPIEDYFYI